MIEITIDTSKFDRMMSDIPGALARAQRKALEGIGSAVEEIARNSFTKDKSLRPSPWAPRKDKKKHALLLRSTDMWREIKHKVISDDTVAVGTKADYAKYHQFGTKHMPARPFFPIDKTGQLTPVAQRTVQQKIENAYKAELEKLYRQ